MNIKNLIAYFSLFLLIILCISPSLGWLDSSELTSACFLLGISHPPGQPLYMMMGKLSQLIPLGNHALRLNLLSGVFLILSFIVFIKIAKHLVKESDFAFKTEILLAAGLLLFTSYSFMIQGVRTELYSLNLFLVCTIIYLFLKGFDLAGFFILGLSLSCHPLLTVALIPGLAVLCLISNKEKSYYFKGLFFIILGMSAYFYLPVRASTLPAYDFGNPSDLTKLFWVMTGKLYKAYGEISGIKLRENVSNIFYVFIYQLNPLTLLLGLSGLLLFFRKRVKIAVFIVLIFIFNIIVILRNMHFHVDNPDAHGYLMISMATVALGFIIFIAFISDILKKKQPEKNNKYCALAFLAVLIVLISIQIVVHRSRYDKREDYTARIFSERLVRDTAYGSVIFTGSFLTYSILSYKIFEEKFRDDLALIFTGFMANKGYSESVRHNYPFLGFLKPGSNSRLLKEDLDRINSSGKYSYIELSLMEKNGDYGLRYSDEILNNLIHDGWFFAFGSKEKLYSRAGYEDFFREDIVRMYKSGGYELKKNILLAIFLHVKYAQYKNDIDLAKFLLKIGLTLNDGFDAFKKIKKEIDFNE